eukprot:130393_1
MFLFAVLLSTFISCSVHGLDTCVANHLEDLPCTTPCNGNCATFLRGDDLGDNNPRDDASCQNGQQVRDCRSTQELNQLQNANECWNTNQWVDAIWDNADANEKDTGAVGPGRTLARRKVTLFSDKLSQFCRVQRSFAAGQAQNAIQQLNQDSCNNYQGRGDKNLLQVNGLNRHYLYIMGEDVGTNMVAKWCDKAAETRRLKTPLKNALLARFLEKSQLQKRIQQSQALNQQMSQGTRTRTAAVIRAHAGYYDVFNGMEDDSSRRSNAYAVADGDGSNTWMQGMTLFIFTGFGLLICMMCLVLCGFVVFAIGIKIGRDSTHSRNSKERVPYTVMDDSDAIDNV